MLFLGASSGVFFWLFVLVLESDLILARMASAVLCEEAERFDPVQEWERFSRRIGEVADRHAAFFRVSGSTVVPVPAGPSALPTHYTRRANALRVQTDSYQPASLGPTLPPGSLLTRLTDRENRHALARRC